jgi:hypothetical protein
MWRGSTSPTVPWTGRLVNKEVHPMQDNTHELKVLMLDAASGFYRMQRYRVGDFFGPVDLGIHLAFKHNALTIGAGLLAGSVFPGSNRLIFAASLRVGTGFMSPPWGVRPWFLTTSGSTCSACSAKPGILRFCT